MVNIGQDLADLWSRLPPLTLSIAILIGIAPLLFVQVIYDPFWYVANTLSAWWVLAFILFIMIGYFSTYVFYLKGESSPDLGKVAGVIAVIFFVLASIVMHALNYQALLPEKWFKWHFREMYVDTSGGSLHAFQLPRFLHFMIPAFAMTGILFMLYAWYFKEREDFDKNYLSWVGSMGAKLAFIASLIQAGVGFWWLLSLPPKFNFMTNPFFLLALLSGLILLAFLYKAQSDPVKNAIPALILSFVVVLLMSAAREALRVLYIAEVNYSVSDYKVNLDWGSTILFLLTFIMGLVVISYQLAVAFYSGRSSKVLEETPTLAKWGNLSIILLILWILIVGGLGIIITIKNFLM
ncbi:MAG: hypothetical protein RMI63_06320 [Caldimicrobium sp.]|nr:hypothetical protein [Caldimicrobium sp.]